MCEMINLKHIVWDAIVIRRATRRAPRHNYVGGFFVRVYTSFRNGQRVGRGGGGGGGEQSFVFV